MSVAILGSLDGVGGLILAIQCADVIQMSGLHDQVDVYLSARDEVFGILKELFGFEYHLIQWPADIQEDSVEFQRLRDTYGEAYFVCPDMLFRNKYAFDCKKYNTTPQNIRKRHLLECFWRPTKEIGIYFNTTTPNYDYYDPLGFAVGLAELFPDYTIYLPIITEWAGQHVQWPQFGGVRDPHYTPKNLKIDYNPNHVDALKHLRQCEYVVCADNGMSHIAAQFGVPKTVLAYQFGKFPWIVRWFSDYLDYIPIHTETQHLINLVETNIRAPETNLLPRNDVLGQIVFQNAQKQDWARKLLFKI